MSLNRRQFIKSGCALTLGTAFAPVAFAESLPAPSKRHKAHIVFVPGKNGIDILDEQDIDVVLYPASLTKLALPACYFDLKKQGLISAREEDIKEVERQLSHTLIRSHNGDATQVAHFLANQYCLRETGEGCSSRISEEVFTRRILPPFFESLGMTSTHFFNSSGLPGDETDTLDNRTTVRDMALLINHIMQKHADEVLAITSRLYFNERLKWGPNTNPMLPGSPRDYARPYEGVQGLKTGKTDDAGDQLATIVTRSRIQLGSINCGADSKEESAEKATGLLNRGFETLEKRANQVPIINPVAGIV